MSARNFWGRRKAAKSSRHHYEEEKRKGGRGKRKLRKEERLRIKERLEAAATFGALISVIAAPAMEKKERVHKNAPSHFSRIMIKCPAMKIGEEARGVI